MHKMTPVLIQLNILSACIAQKQSHKTPGLEKSVTVDSSITYEVVQPR
jgi:hypothetical protein